MVNGDVRRRIFESELTQREIAKALGISHEHLCRLLSKELSDRNQERILEAIDQVRQSKSA